LSLASLACLAALLALPAPAEAARSTIEVRRDGNLLNVSARATLAADVQTAFATLTDYEGLAQFVPGITRSRVLARSREGAREQLLVEQSGELRVLFFTVPLRVWLQVTHEPPHRIDAVAVQPSGTTPTEADLKQFSGSYELREGEAGLELSYRATIEPGFTLLPWLGTWAARQVVESRFVAMVEEIERRGRATVNLPAR
jgi:Polyketide cyclase / dehydrase and lipid transport